MHTHLENSPAHKGQSKKSNESNFPVSKPSQVLVKAQLEMTTSGDSAEREADAVADSIVTEGKIARSVSTGHSGGGIALPSQFASQISSFQGQGSRIAGDLKTKMESGFGRDFSNVRLHTDNAAAEMSSSISAKAFTYGNDIFFNRGQYSPDTKDGQHLIAHELAHIEQGNGSVSRKPIIGEKPNDEMCKILNCSDVNFTEEELKVVTSALIEAKSMLEKAIESIDTDKERGKYFGAKNNKYPKIKENLRRIYNALLSDKVRVLLHKDNRPRQTESLYNVTAFVSNKDDAVDIALRGLFFAENDPKSLSDSERAATLIHELAHDVIQANRPSDGDEYFIEEVYGENALRRARHKDYYDYVIQNASNYELYCLKFASKK